MSVFTSSIFGDNNLPVNIMRGGIQLKLKRDVVRTRPVIAIEYFKEQGPDKITFTGIIEEPGLMIIECLSEGDGLIHQAHLLDYRFSEGDKYMLDFERIQIIGKNIVEFEVTLLVASQEYKQKLRMRFR